MIGMLVTLLVFGGLVVLLPLLALRLLFGLALGLVLLPFKLLGVVFRVVGGLLGVFLKVLFSGVGLVFGLLAAVFFVVLLPLLPLLVLGALIWAMTRLFRSPATLVRA
jgi:hypothetical protein